MGNPGIQGIAGEKGDHVSQKNSIISHQKKLFIKLLLLNQKNSN